MNSFWRDVISYLLGPNAEPGTTQFIYSKNLISPLFDNESFSIHRKEASLRQCGTQDMEHTSLLYAIISVFVLHSKNTPACLYLNVHVMLLY